MGCPNKKKDKEIIAEIERRRTVPQELDCQSFTWIGAFIDIQWIGIDLENIISITKDDERQWTALVKI